VGVPYTHDQIANAVKDLETQADPFAAPTGLKTRYGAKVNQRKFDTEPGKGISEMDALIAYLQVTGTMVDFKTYKAKDPENLR